MTWIEPLAVAIIGPILAWAGIRWGRKGDRENALIDQLQEERGANRDRLDALEHEMHELRLELVSLRARDAQWEWHTDRVEQQVVDLGGIPHLRPLGIRPHDDDPPHDGPDHI